jgi:invasion protein IalB
MARAILRSVAVLCVLAGVLYAGWIASGSPPLPRALGDFASAVTGGNGVRPGYTGMAQFDDWRLICVPGPDARVAVGPDDAPVNAGNACRLNQEVPDPQAQGQIILAANLSTVGPLRKPALMLRLPPTFRPGNSITLRIDQDRIVRTAVRDCSERECVAASDLSDEDWQRLIMASELQVMFAVQSGSNVFVDLGVDGLSEAAAALDMAQISQ